MSCQSSGQRHEKKAASSFGIRFSDGIIEAKKDRDSEKSIYRNQYEALRLSTGKACLSPTSSGRPLLVLHLSQFTIVNLAY